jgi:hypothetical protein
MPSATGLVAIPTAKTKKFFGRNPDESPIDDCCRLWTQGDPRYGILPLKAWTKKMHNETVQLSRIFSQRKIIIDEITRAGGVDAFKQKYPLATNTVSLA